MNKAIQHRGPDDEGFWLLNKNGGKSFSGIDSTEKIKSNFPILEVAKSQLALGFRRLSIVDLSENGHQPMTSKGENLIITFNGEIYNFKELRSQLEGLNYQFKSNSDTEVLLKSYDEWGTRMFAQLDGMFALCIVDLHLKKIIFGRDRMGLKPLFYTQNENGLIWASEIKALLKNEFVHPEINWNGVYTNFLFQTTLAPETCFKNIFSLESGNLMILNLENNSIEKEKFWTLNSKINSEISEEEAVKKIDELLSKSVAEQLYADVPVTSMMSGGIDSTLITVKAKPSKNDVNAFTIQYKFAEDEVKNAALVAEHLKIKHHIKSVSDEDVLQDLKENIQHFEEPYSSLEVLMNAAEYAKNLGFKVVLSGNGADELFGGYGHTLKLKKWLHLKNFNFVRNFIFTKDEFSERVKNYFSQNFMFDFFRQSQVGMKPSEAENVFKKDIFKEINPNLKRFHLSETKDYSGYFEYDMKYSLSSHHVFRDDLSAMKYGVEFRYPYLSNELIDFVSTLPEKFRFNGIQNKPLLRKIAEDYLPKEVLNMPKKGFSFPLNHFIKNEEKVQNFITENLESLKKRNFFKPETIDKWLKNQNNIYDCVKIWQLVTFELWYQKYF